MTVSSTPVPPQRRGRLPLVAALVAAVAIVAISTASVLTRLGAQPVTLRLQVSLTPEELAAFQPAVEAIDAVHPEWIVQLEEVPQGSEAERITADLARGAPADVIRIQGANVQQWIRRDAFVPLDARLRAAGIDIAGFYPGPVDQFRFDGRLWGVPDSASPEIVFFDRAAFEDAGIEPPDETWTYEDMREAALALTVDSNGRHPGNEGFDPDAIERWGWNGGITYFWQRSFIRALGGELCANEDCTEMRFTGPANLEAFEWWVSLVRDDHAALYDPYGGSQTGVPGDPFIAGKAAMGSNGSFAIGQLDAAGRMDYDIVPPLLGVDGNRYTPLSTNGYVLAAQGANQDAAWALVRELITEDFLASTWGRPGHAVPALRTAAPSILEAGSRPIDRTAILEAMEVGEVFKPYTASAFAAYGATIDLFTRMNKGELPIPDALAQIEVAANEALAPDRAP
ncbi:MAG TPA: extracellular solute-binding protein [Candidatus Binatia bacterium]|nr:extracellular solute-binding protein [Candidatus Binatia bacterium]